MYTGLDYLWVSLEVRCAVQSVTKKLLLHHSVMVFWESNCASHSCELIIVTWMIYFSTNHFPLSVGRAESSSRLDTQDLNKYQLLKTSVEPTWDPIKLKCPCQLFSIILTIRTCQVNKRHDSDSMTALK